MISKDEARRLRRLITEYEQALLEWAAGGGRPLPADDDQAVATDPRRQAYAQLLAEIDRLTAEP